MQRRACCWHCCRAAAPNALADVSPLPRTTTERDQLSSDRVLELLKFDGRRPIWSAPLFSELHELAAHSERHLSPLAYPHASADIALALRSVSPQLGGQNASVAVFSSISPWIEVLLLRTGFHHVATYDYNPPLIQGEPRVTSRHANAEDAAGWLDLAVSFSGIEHDGLTRYGDPFDPEGDVAAIRQFACRLRTGGILLLGVPTGSPTRTIFPSFRLYGPDRVLQILGGAFDLLGHVWDGREHASSLEDVRSAASGVLHGGGAAHIFPSYRGALNYPGVRHDWQFQPVLMLRKREQGGARR